MTTPRRKDKGKVNSLPQNSPPLSHGRASSLLSGDKTVSTRYASPGRGSPLSGARSTDSSPPPMPEKPSPPMFADSDGNGDDEDLIGETFLCGAKQKAGSDLPSITLVYEGRGGTFYYGPDVEEKYHAFFKGFGRDSGNVVRSKPKTDYFLMTKAIGTQMLVTCVGVFFRIGIDRLFLAHIDIFKEGVTGTARYLAAADKGKVDRAIYERLTTIAGQQGWTPGEVAVESAVVVTLEASPTALAVQSGVAHFLGLKNPNEVKFHNWSGFVVEDGRISMKLSPAGQWIHGYEVSTFTNEIAGDKWRYMVDRGWDVSPYSAGKKL